jgi:hypothetical protein
LRCPEIPERIVYARQPRRLPIVLSADEVVRFLEAAMSRAVLKFARQASLSEQATRPWRAVQDRG